MAGGKSSKFQAQGYSPDALAKKEPVPSRADAILFDFDGTLVDYVEADIQSLKIVYARAGSTVPFDDFLETSINEIMHFHNLVAEHKIDPLQMHRFRLMNTFARYHIVWNDAYLTDYRKKLVELSIPFSGVKPLLSRIKNKVKVGLITNAYNGAEQRERIRYSGLESFFDVITIAGEIGVYKPDPSLFLYALNCVDIAPGKALYIGDSVAYDVVGAKTAGMGTVLFSRQPQSNNDIADYTVQNMEKLKGLLDQLIG